MKHMNLTLLGIVLLATLGLPAGALAQQSYTEDFTTTTYQDVLNTTARWDTAAGELKLFPFVPRLAGSYDTPGEARCVAISGDHAFVADSSFGLHVVDISDPAHPTLAGSYDTPGTAFGVAVSGDHAFVADYGSGLQVIDISDPANPTAVGNCATGGFAYDVAVSGDLAFVADGWSGLRVIDISHPTNPTLAGTYVTTAFAYDVAVSGDHAFVAGDWSGLQVIDISNPANPSLAGSYDTPGMAYGVAVSGDQAFVADKFSGLQVIDISDPANPTFAGSCDTPGEARRVAVSGDHAFVTDYGSGLQVIDISDPANPTLAGTCDTPGIALGAAVSGDRAFVADHSSGLQVIEISKVTNPALVGTYDTPGIARGVAVSGDYAFVTDLAAGLQVIDINDPTNPLLAGNCATPGNVWGVAVWGDNAYLAAHDFGFLVIDIGDLTNPSIVGTCSVPYARGVAVSGNHAFVADDGSGGGLRVIDISNPTNPIIVGLYNTGYGLNCVAVSGNNAYAVNGELFHVLNISDPANPMLVGFSGEPGYGLGVAVSGNHAYVADAYNGLLVFDISNSTNPVLVGSCRTLGWASGVTVSGDRAFVADGIFLGDENPGLTVIDISDPTHPIPSGIFNMQSGANWVAVSGDHAFVADGNNGLQVIQVYQSEVDSDNKVGWSLVLDASIDMLLKARLTTTQTNTVTWELSGDGGANWQGFAPDGNWSPLTNPGIDLLWRSTHTWVAPGVNPGVTRLKIDWLVEAAAIDSIVDVKNDQGGWVSVHFTRSGLDFSEETTLPIASYGIWRQVDDPVLSAALGDQRPAVVQKSAGDLGLDLSGMPVVTYQGRVFIQSGTELAATSFPPGTWQWVATVPAVQLDTYNALVPTMADSSATGPHAIELVMTAHTTTPSIWYVSYPGSGWSVDNLAPGVPQNIQAAYLAGGVTLDWDDAPEVDFQFYRIYRGTDEGFVPSPDNLIHETTASGWTDPATNPWSYHYKVTVMDHSGNESEAGSPGDLSGVQDRGVPVRTALLGAVPNPFNPSTKLSFEMAAAGNARLNVYDTAGRLVVTLVNERRDAGLNEVIWDGRDHAGRISSAGVYLYRLEVEDYVETKRMTLVK